MGSVDSFLSKFGSTAEVMPETNLLSAGAPNALAAFMGTFTPLTESYWFYNHTEELRYNKEEHVYFRVDPELGNLTELYGVTNVLKKAIDRSLMLTPWAAKMAIEKLLGVEVPAPSASTRVLPKANIAPCRRRSRIGADQFDLPISAISDATNSASTRAEGSGITLMMRRSR